jgi:GNAT superfamily N-acetyltransferase
VVSDYATFACLGDVFGLPEDRGKGYGKALMEAILAHPELQGLRRFSLATSDAHARMRATDSPRRGIRTR